MIDKEKIQFEIDSIINNLLHSQASDGSWRYCFESGTMTDSYMLILLKVLDISDKEWTNQLYQRILSRQRPEGYWSVYPDEKNGNLSATVEAFYALLYSGYLSENDPMMKKAKTYILSSGGLSKVNSVLTKVLLAATGQYPWPTSYTFPIEFILLPDWSPFNFYDIVGYARVHIVPILIMSNQRFVIKTASLPDLSDLLIDKHREQDLFQSEVDSSLTYRDRNLMDQIKKEWLQLLHSPNSVKQDALDRAEKFILERIEPDGTLYSYASATFLMIFAFLALGYDRRHSRIIKAIKGLKGFMCQTDNSYHMVNSTSTVWDTALISHALQRARVSTTHPAIMRAGTYLFNRQTVMGDWSKHNDSAIAGGWGFSDSNTMNPDVDDSTAALRAIHRLAAHDNRFQEAYDKGFHWVLSMQNDDGGWSAFEKNINKAFLNWLPYDGADAALIDPSTADLSGRALEYLGSMAKLTIKHPFIQKAVNWLKENQEEDGSWYGKWGICYIYGTWAAVTGMKAVGVEACDPAIVKATKWLMTIQNSDGGWGESCSSDKVKRYVHLHAPRHPRRLGH